LEQAYQAVHSEYVEARSSVRYRITTQLAAQKNVDMERARYELEEHRRVCSAAILPKLLVSRDESKRSRTLAA
jgi:hypothetical protein